MKRVIDLLLAFALMLILLLPVLIGAALVFMFVGRPVLFKQIRAGRHGKPFQILKLRTMSDGCDRTGEPLPDSQRLGSVGRVLRASSVDEVPQLWNVMKGEMSLVGPRPLPMQYISLYSDLQARRLEVKPGVTGLAQISGRNELSWDRKLSLDVEYVDRRSTLFDIKILALTIAEVVRARGITAKGEPTVQPFRGSPASGNPIDCQRIVPPSR